MTIRSVPYQTLISNKMPLTFLIESQGHSTIWFSLIALFAITNGILVQIIMASRLIYGMARQQNAPKVFLTVSTKTQTPLLATAFVILAILILAFLFPIQTFNHSIFKVGKP